MSEIEDQERSSIDGSAPALDFSGNPIMPAEPAESGSMIDGNDETKSMGTKIDDSGNPVLPPSGAADEMEEEGSIVAVKRIGRTMTFFNLINTLIGAGIVSVPSTFTGCGIGPTVLLLVLSCFLCNIAGVIIVGLQHDLRTKGLNEIAYHVLGKVGMNVISVLLIIFCASCTVAYLIIGSNQVVSWLSLAGLNMKGLWKWALVVIIYCCALPGAMTFPRHIDCLSKMAVPSVLGVILYLVAIIVKACMILPKNGSPTSTKGIDMGMGIFTAFGVHALTFSLQIVMMPIITPYNPSVQKRSRVLGYTFLTSFLIIMIPGLLGYLIFGKDTKSDVLTSFPNDDILMIFVRIGMFISVSASYPAIVLSIVASLGQMIWNENLPEEMPTRHRLILIPAVNIFNLIISIFLQDIKPILGVGGSLGGCIVGFVFPSLCRLITRKEPLTSVWNILHILFVIFGLASACLCTYSSVNDAIVAFSK